MERLKLNEFGFPVKDYLGKEDASSLKNVRVETFAPRRKSREQSLMFVITDLFKERQEKFLRQVFRFKKVS